MINFDSFTTEIENFIRTSIQKFLTENNTPTLIGIYCCPWAGWITTNFNTDKSKDEVNNCPDFEYVEYDFFELDGWQDEFESDNPKYVVNGHEVIYNHDLGNEEINRIVFNFLKPIILKIKTENKTEFLLQMLDSNYQLKL